MPETALDSSLVEQLRERLQHLYGERAEEALKKLTDCLDRHISRTLSTESRAWDQRDVILITYGDQVRSSDATPLQTLHQFLLAYRLHELIRNVHLLPFFPYSSDDGFSVIDYREVDPALGDWSDIGRLGEAFELVFDFVVNHVSQHSRWFHGYLSGVEPYKNYFIEADPREDLSAVTRPRSLPLLTECKSANDGTRHVWTTFSGDQIDLNYANPEVLVEMVDTLLDYVSKGARVIRLDAIAYLWKEIGTSCIHLPQVHTVVKLFRDVLEALAQGVWLLTETNVPHQENVSYFGDGDEAHMVYQFSLPPLLLDAFLNEDAGPLADWLSDLDPPPPGTTYFNFTASHDGVGVRPLEGLVSAERFARLVDAVKARGGLVSTRRQPDGTDTAYELNISYVSALGDPDGAVDDHARQFLASQALMLGLQGIPGVYFHSLFGTENDLPGVEQSGHPRRINRRKFDRQELDQRLGDPDSLAARVFDGYRNLLRVRIAQPAFHPDAAQGVVRFDEPCLVGWTRTSSNGQKVLVLGNVSGKEQHVDLSPSGLRYARDLLTDEELASDDQITLSASQVVWLEAVSPD